MDTDAPDATYTTLRRAVLELDLVPGQQVSERSLSEDLRVSRTPVRAALARLVDDGLVERHGRSWRVTPIDTGDIQNAMRFREVVEVGALEITYGIENTAALQGLFTRVEESFAVERNVIQDCDSLHKQLVALSGNQYFSVALDSVLVRLARPRWIAAQEPEIRSVARDEHLLTLTRLQRRDLEGAKQALTAHISGLHNRLETVLDREQRRLRAFSIQIK